MSITFIIRLGNPINKFQIFGIIQNYGIKKIKDIYLCLDNSIPGYNSISDCGFDIFK